MGGEGARRATRAGRFGSGALEGRVEIRRSGCGAGAGALVSPPGRNPRRGHVREGSEETVNYATAGRGVSERGLLRLAGAAGSGQQRRRGARCGRRRRRDERQCSRHSPARFRIRCPSWPWSGIGRFAHRLQVGGPKARSARATGARHESTSKRSPASCLLSIFATVRWPRPSVDPIVLLDPRNLRGRSTLLHAPRVCWRAARSLSNAEHFH